MNLADEDLGNLDQALASTLKSLEINLIPTAHMAASTKIWATSIRRLLPLSNHSRSILITPLPI